MTPIARDSTPHAGMVSFFNHPAADDDLVAKMIKTSSDEAAGMVSTPLALMCSPVIAQNDTSHETAIWQRETMEKFAAQVSG